MYVGTETRASEVSGRPRLYRQWELSPCRRDTDGAMADTLRLELRPDHPPHPVVSHIVLARPDTIIAQSDQ